MTSITIWTRLEPRCRNEEMDIALEARTHDPFWMLSRQWQLGEFLGDDAGSPIVASVASVDMPLDRYSARGGTAQKIPQAMPLEAWIEQEEIRPSGTIIDYRQSAESGLQFLRLIRDAKMGKYIANLLAHYAIAPPSAAELSSMDAAASRLVSVAGKRVPDGVRLAADLLAAHPGLPPALAIAAADNAAVSRVAKNYLDWYDALFDEPPSAGENRPAPSPAWVDERMEYSFALDASGTDAPGAFVANQYAGEPLAWAAFDYVATPLGPVAAPAAPITRTFIPTPVVFKGMPARRFWELEDAAVDIGAIEAGPTDLGRLMLREFALIYGNDWFIIPLPVLAGSVSRISSLVVTDTFGIQQTIPHYSQTSDGGRWQMYAVAGDVVPHRLVMPPALARNNSSDPIEQVLLVRDEAANMAWGIEKIVQGQGGAPINRAPLPSATEPGSMSSSASGSPRYQLGTSVPASYIPFLPVSVNSAMRRMQRAAFLRTDGSPGIVGPLGRFLATDTPLFEEEFAREGITLERRYRLACGTDGSTHLWVARRKEIGVTARASGLQFDQVIERME